ncbi:hypothetical protein [Streptomyces sp. MJP52]|uniref:helix-turn-helix domain-containing protein n=1 Tax=Streptomyces sp. MJP52 TaxID=2940555 RepID=UPI0024757134|nr:hypothetical protein [Streptomyces sp. MJP52]MDH6226240.1 transcriptional regulator with XRE-family HTH domain [Streptomyces sp. MJP52]
MSTEHAPSNGCYQAGCRLEACVEARRRYQLRLRYDHSQGIHRLVDATQARAHAERLVARDWTHRQIADAAGIARSTVTKILSGAAQTNRRAAAAILSVELTQEPPFARRRIDATGTRRRLQALMVLGYSAEALAPHVGVWDRTLHALAHEEMDRVDRRTAAAVATVYRAFVIQPPPTGGKTQAVRRRARSRGWYGPAAWDRIDDPWCQPEEEPVRMLAGAQPADIDLDRVRALAARGMSDAEIGQELRVSGRTILRRRKEHGIPAGLQPGVTAAAA